MTIADDAHALVARSRHAQGLPPQITDPAALAYVAAVLAGARRDSARGAHARALVNDTITMTDPTGTEGAIRGPA